MEMRKKNIMISECLEERSTIVHFTHQRADGSIFFFYPYKDKQKVFVLGDFNDWELPGWPMIQTEEGWEYTTDVLPEGHYSYKFLADGEWCRDPYNALSSSDGYDGVNSLIYCGCEEGSLHHFTFFSSALDTERWYLIYLPPRYFIDEKRYHTLYLIHGALDWEWTWLEKAGINSMLNSLIAENRIGEMAVVMPRENAELYKGDHRFGYYLANDLLNHIEGEFRTLPEHRGRAVDGLSTGGYDAFYLSALHPELFCSVGAMSGTFNDMSYEMILENREEIRKNRNRYILSCGTNDAGRESTRTMAKFLSSQSFEVEHYENQGPHEWDYWKSYYPVSMEFHWKSFERFLR